MRGKLLICFLFSLILPCSLAFVGCNDNEIIEREIVYELDNGTNNPLNPNTLNSDEEFTLLEPTREYFDFDGWYTSDSFQSQVTTITKGKDTQIILYAKWVIQEEYGLYEVLSGSMMPTIEIGDGTVTQKVDSNLLEVGDVIVFNYSSSSNQYIIHRIVEKIEEDGQIKYRTKGDSNVLADNVLVTLEMILGKVIDITPMPLSEKDNNLDGSVTFTPTFKFSTYAENNDVEAMVSLDIENSNTELIDMLFTSESQIDNFLPLSFNETKELLTLKISIDNMSFDKILFVSLNRYLIDESNLSLQITWNGQSYVSGSSIMLLPMNSAEILVTFSIIDYNEIATIGESYFALSLTGQIV